RAAASGMELPKLMAILGHSNLRSIMKYIHMTQAHIDEGMRQFEAAILPGSCPVATGKMGKTRAIKRSSGKTTRPAKLLILRDLMPILAGGAGRNRTDE